MVLTCPKCNSRLQLDEDKTPARPFSVRCPKCQTSVSVQPDEDDSASVQDAQPFAAANSTNISRPFERPAIAQPFKPTKEKVEATVTADTTPVLSDLAKLFAEALRQAQSEPTGNGLLHSTHLRKALVCASPAFREAVAELLTNSDYKVFVAENMAQGLGRMREERMDVLILEANFDPLEQGVAFITREVRLLRPSERRRLFFVSVTDGVRTMDLHAAFLQNVNLVVNPSDIEQLPEALEVSIRHYDELYLPFTRALDIAAV
jgi:predicted Zn finger-like uncharacterized protein